MGALRAADRDGGRGVPLQGRADALSAAVATRGLAKTYSGILGRNEVRALRPLDLTVEVGEIFGLLGPNGAGKTTLVKLLLGIVHPTEGGATIFDRPIGDSQARRSVGFLPEDHRFPDFLTGRQTLRLYARMAGLAADERDARAVELLARVRLTEAADRKVRTYSKGMMQRLGLAQAMMNRPRLLVLDEPADGVDPVGRREIRDVLVELRDEGATLFLNSHLLSEIERVCTRVAILKEGRLVRHGTVEELTTEERVWRLRATPVPESAATELGESLRPGDGDEPAGLGRYRLLATDRAELNRHLDVLRAAGVEIESVEPLRTSLEDFFVDVVSR
ncbi:MAG: ABC transporter ATP-binding protein [Gemmatimonadetes bacterium]|nr:ABC transporter ATP-binding protein [Gemmatimonadota bacterium]